MSNTKDFIVEQLKQQITGFKSEVKEQTVGRVIEVGDGIARISGLSDVMMSEMIEFTTREFYSNSSNKNKSNKSESKKVYGVALNLEEDSVGAIILGDYTEIKEGDEVRCLKRILQVPVGDNIIGRVLDSLGRPLDGKGEIETDKFYSIEKIAPGVIARESVSQPVQTGIKAIDAMIRSAVARGSLLLEIGRSEKPL